MHESMRTVGNGLAVGADRLGMQPDLATAEIGVFMKRTDADTDSSTADARPILPQLPTLGDLRQTMIREAAYFHALHRGFAPGRELDDWLAAELDIGSRLP